MKITLPAKLSELVLDYAWDISLKSQSLVYTDQIGDVKYSILIKGRIPDWFPKKLKKALNYMKDYSPKRYLEVLESTRKIKVGRRSNPDIFGQAVGSGVIYINNEIFKDTVITDLASTIFHEVKHNKGFDESSAKKAEDDFLDEMHSLRRHPMFQDYVGKRDYAS